MLKAWQNHPFFKSGLIGISLLCYAVMLLHPLLAHASGSWLQEVAPEPFAFSKSVGDSIPKFARPLKLQSDCLTCQQVAGNPASGSVAGPLLTFSGHFAEFAGLSVFSLGSKSFLMPLSRAPPGDELP